MRVIKIFFLCLIAIACQKRNLSKKDKEWNTYTLNQELVFNSDKNRTINLRVSEIEENKVKTNIYAGNLSRKRETLTVFVMDDNGEEFPFLTIYKNSEGKGFLHFNLALPGYLEVNQVESLDDINLETHLGFTDVYSKKIDTVTTVSTPSVIQFYFSKEKGYLQFETSEGEIFTIEDI